MVPLLPTAQCWPHLAKFGATKTNIFSILLFFNLSKWIGETQPESEQVFPPHSSGSITLQARSACLINQGKKFMKTEITITKIIKTETTKTVTIQLVNLKSPKVMKIQIHTERNPFSSKPACFRVVAGHFLSMTKRGGGW